VNTFFKSIAVLVLASSVALSADVGTVVQTKDASGPVVKNTFTWTSGTNNFVLGVGDTYVKGEILRIVFNPSITIAPTGSYTATLKDGSGIDILAGQGALLASNTVTTIVPAIRFTDGSVTNVSKVAINDLLTLSATNTGNAKSGQIIIYTR